MAGTEGRKRRRDSNMLPQGMNWMKSLTTVSPKLAATTSSFAPICLLQASDPAIHTLILGTHPSVKSLASGKFHHVHQFHFFVHDYDVLAMALTRKCHTDCLGVPQPHTAHTRGADAELPSPESARPEHHHCKHCCRGRPIYELSCPNPWHGAGPPCNCRVRGFQRARDPATRRGWAAELWQHPQLLLVDHGHGLWL